MAHVDFLLPDRNAIDPLPRTLDQLLPPDHSARIVWDSIALHTTPGIPEHKEPEVALVTAGVEFDVLGLGYDDITPEARDAVLTAFPRVDFKERIIQAFADGMAHRPETAFGTVNADVLADKVPGYQRPNFCTIIRSSKHSN